jgi:uncharacterized protein with HEPN domain
MSRDYTVYLLHILDAITIIESYAAELTEDSFRQNRLIQDGVIRNLEIIGEATKKLPKRLTNKYPDIEWKKMAGMRDVLIHDYFGVDLERVWGVVRNRLPDLKENITKILADLSKPNLTGSRPPLP